MSRFAAFVLALSISGCYGGCGKKKEAEGLEPPQAVSAQPPETPAKLTGDDFAKRFDQCWDAWNQAAWDKFAACYAPDATLESPGTGEPPSKGPTAIVAGTKELKTGFPDMTGASQLVLVHGHDLAAITLISGTHTGPFPGVTEMNQKLGILMGQVMTLDDQGRTVKEAAYFDSGTMMGQLGGSKDHPVRPAQAKLAAPEEVVIAKDDAAEQANIKVVQQLIDAANKHDPKAFGDLLADDATWSEQEEAKDWTKAEVIADHQDGWKAFSDIKLTTSAMWGAGSYVVTTGTIDGTNDGPMPMLAKPTHKKVSLPFLEIAKVDGGKITKTWVFAQGMAFMQQLGLLPATGSAGSAK